ncbi:MAG: membrane-bound lytic murein transglycosylase MltF, partial [Gammaproteobacteria bacterium]
MGSTGMYPYKKFRRVRCLLLCAVISAIYGCADQQTTWDRIIKTGQLRFATVASPVTCYRTSTGFAGIECELARRLADELDVELILILARNPYAAVTMVACNQADISGAGLVGRMEDPDLGYSPAFYHAALQLVKRRGDPGLAQIDSPGQNRIPVTAEKITLLRRDFPQVHWQAMHHSDTATLLRMVQEGKFSATVADSYQFNFYKHLYPDLRIASQLAAAQAVSWIYRHDDVLARRIAFFVRAQEESGELKRLQEQYFGHVGAFDANAAIMFLAMAEKRLPLYEELFRETATTYGMDWTLLAAMSYQESHWHPYARSTTGVRGLMMLTEDTAAELGVNDRIDPPQSVDGGARYYHALLEKIPPRITDPDRTWFALAAYNIGFQHLEDARILTQELGGNPDRWEEVRKYLPLLEDDQWHVRTEYGKARGGEAVHYVGNIRIYEDILRWSYPGREKKEYVQPDLGEWAALG